MTLAIDSPISKAEQALVMASTPGESRLVEAMAAAAKAWAREQDDFELAYDAALIYIQARCKTTELIEPTIKQGRPIKGDDNVTFLEDYGFTRKQWSRRKRELEASKKLFDYQDDCVEKRVLPSPYGLVGFVNNQYGVSGGANILDLVSDDVAIAAATVKKAAKDLRSQDVFDFLDSLRFWFRYAESFMGVTGCGETKVCMLRRVCRAEPLDDDQYLKQLA
ncbi:unnamed protein product, partial [marine sediment metagenome]